MTLLYNANLIKLKNDSAAKRNKMAHSVGKEKFYQTQPQGGLQSRFLSVDSRANFENKRETIRNFYIQEKGRETASNGNEFSNLHTVKSSQVLFEHKKQHSGVSLKLTDSKENRLPREFSQSIGFPSKQSNEIIDSQLRASIAKRVKLNFTANPIYAKFKKLQSPDRKNLDTLKSSMVHVINQIDRLERDQKEYTLNVLPSLGRLSKIQTSSLLVLNKKLKNKEPELLR
jgi:hypothetical protein